MATERSRRERSFAPCDRRAPDTLVTGGTGFIGRWLLVELTRREQTVAVLLRPPLARFTALQAWVSERGGNGAQLVAAPGDLEVVGLGLDEATDQALAGIRDVFSLAGRFEFGLDERQARRANVDAPLHLARWAAGRPGLRRFVHVSGYRVGGMLADDEVPLSGPAKRRLYAQLGGYEASKCEGDAILRAEATGSGLPLTLVNPSTVIGHATTGETSQYLGLASIIADLWRGKLPLVPGSKETFVPIVAVDHLARVMAALPERDDPPGTGYWVLAEDTPPLVDLLADAARHLGVNRPLGTIPTGIVRRIPRRLTGAEPETLTFLSTDRYPTQTYRELLEHLGTPAPAATDVVHHWLDHLIGTGFGARTAPPGPRFVAAAGSRTFLTGPTQGADIVLVHGLPHDGTSWAPLVPHLPSTPLTADLPATGRSSPTSADPGTWLAAALAAANTAAAPVLVGHSLGAATILEHVAAGGQARAVVLISPFFLQRPAPWALRAPFAPALLRRATAARLTGTARDAALDGATEPVYQASARNLRRRGVARAVANALRRTSTRAARDRLQRLLDTIDVPVMVVAGERDPLLAATRHPVTVVPGAGHDVHITHPEAVAKAITNHLRNLSRSPLPTGAPPPTSTR